MLSAQSARRLSAAILILANVVPLLGVVAFGWDVASLLFIYWLESAVVGFYNVLKLILARGQPRPRRPRPDEHIREEDMQKLAAFRQAWAGKSRLLDSLVTAMEQSARKRVQAESASAAIEEPPPSTPAAALTLAKLTLVPFFLVHYGLFMGVHLAFLLAFFGTPRLPTIDLAGMAGLLFASHGVSFGIHFLMRGEYREVSPSDQMFAPYGRIAIMHITILIGGLLVMSFGAPVLALAVMVLLKIGIDLTAHLRSHAQLAETTTSA